ncbi:MAG TPA: hypothetical protein PL185_03615 [Flavobacteriales bacterium]|nr:hypothetical protein [Flavobacteriales bacterium]
MNSILPYFLLPALLLCFSCKNNNTISTSQVPVPSNPTSNTVNVQTTHDQPIKIETKAIPDTLIYSLVVSFYSIGSGIDRPIAQEFDYLVKDFQEQFGDDFSAERIRWGREGELDYCIQLGEMKPENRRQFRERADVILKKSSRVHVTENTTCRRNLR